jgi:uncharacterized protein
LNVCTSCGACCAAWRVDFSVHEAPALPESLTEPLNDTLVRLRGTDHSPPRCAALSGRIGQRATCGVYDWRPGPCRELEPGSDACERARRLHGLPPTQDSRR